MEIPILLNYKIDQKKKEAAMVYEYTKAEVTQYANQKKEEATMVYEYTKNEVTQYANQKKEEAVMVYDYTKDEVVQYANQVKDVIVDGAKKAMNTISDGIQYLLGIPNAY